MASHPSTSPSLTSSGRTSHRALSRGSRPDGRTGKRHAKSIFPRFDVGGGGCTIFRTRLFLVRKGSSRCHGRALFRETDCAHERIPGAQGQRLAMTAGPPPSRSSELVDEPWPPLKGRSAGNRDGGPARFGLLVPQLSIARGLAFSVGADWNVGGVGIEFSGSLSRGPRFEHVEQSDDMANSPDSSFYIVSLKMSRAAKESRPRTSSQGPKGTIPPPPTDL
ncbi:hypothetical protein LX36DRAFT_465562 [Colletotrichum falcatum]|nr:hypothetical protein LX36DRAFT_465562 [Colletotrichum falcatum]